MQVLVVGAGVVGYAVAYELASRGVSVRVVDPRGTGQGATRASAGILAPYIEGHSPTLLQLGLCSLDQYDGFVARVSADAGHSIEYRCTGTLQVALDDAEVRELERQHVTLDDAGVAHTWLDAPAVRRLEPALTAGVRGGLLIPRHGYVAVPNLIAALADAAASRGVMLTVAGVRAVDREGGRLRVVTSDEAFAADAVVMAAGSWSGTLEVEATTPPPVKPVRGQLLHLRVSRSILSAVVWGTGCYLVPWQDGSVLVGATMEDVGFDDRVTVEGVRQLLSSGERLLPGLQEAAFVDARAGLRPSTPDGLPIIGPSSTTPNLYYATGHYRNGVLLAPFTATVVADGLLGGGQARRELELVRPDRFGL